MIERIAELHEAFAWTCDECGADNFVRPIVCENPDMEPPDDDDEGQYMMIPEEVTCKVCGIEFKTEFNE